MKKIKLTESKLISLVEESVKKVLIEAKNKRTEINRLYRIVEPFTRGKYHDTAWAGVDDIIQALNDNGYETTVTVKDGGYRNSRGGNTMFAGLDVSYWKEYDIEIAADEYIIHGQIRCHAAGTMEDPFSSYDMTCTFW